MIAAFLLSTVMGNSPPSLDGVFIGQSVAEVIDRADFPVTFLEPIVRTTNVGHIWTWTKKDGTIERLTTDDNGTVQMVEIVASPTNNQWISVPVVGSLQFNSSGHINAQPGNPQDDLFRDEWLPLPNVAGTVVGYAIAPTYGVIFGFPAGDGGLIEVATGTRDALFTTGLIPPQPLLNTPLLPATSNRRAFKAAELVQIPPCGGFVNKAVIVRIMVSSNGYPLSAKVFPGPASPTAQERAEYCPMHEKFRPATLNGKPVSSIVFQREVIYAAAR